MPEAVRRFLEAPHTGHVLLPFLTITHEDAETPIRLVRDAKAFMKGGSRFSPAPFNATVLTDDEDQPRARLSVPNVNQRISETIRDLTTSPEVQIELYSSQDWNLGNDPRTPTGSPNRFYNVQGLTFEQISISTLEASGDLVVRDYGTEPYGKKASQGRFPALFRGP